VFQLSVCVYGQALGLKPNSFTHSALLKGYTEQPSTCPPDRLAEYVKAFEDSIKVNGSA
jgi:hypothetical protein